MIHIYKQGFKDDVHSNRKIRPAVNYFEKYAYDIVWIVKNMLIILNEMETISHRILIQTSILAAATWQTFTFFSLFLPTFKLHLSTQKSQ